MTSDKQQKPYEALGQHLLELRLQHGWSLRRAAKEIGGISHSRLQDFERGQDPHSAIPTRPTEDQIRRIAKAYRVSKTMLLRLAGYSSVGPLSEWEETVVSVFRELNAESQKALLDYINENFAKNLGTRESQG